MGDVPANSSGREIRTAPASSEEVVGGKERNISLPDPEQPQVGVNLAAPKGQFPGSDAAGLCSSSSSSIQPPHTSHGEQTAHPKPLCCSRGEKHLATSLLREKATKKKKHKIRQFGMLAPLSFPKYF